MKWKKSPHLSRADCPDSVVSGIGSGTLGSCARTEKTSSNKLIRYICNQPVAIYLSSYICQKRKIGKSNKEYYGPAINLLLKVYQYSSYIFINIVLSYISDESFCHCKRIHNLFTEKEPTSTQSVPAVDTTTTHDETDQGMSMNCRMSFQQNISYSYQFFQL